MSWEHLFTNKHEIALTSLRYHQTFVGTNNLQSAYNTVQGLVTMLSDQGLHVDHVQTDTSLQDTDPVDPFTEHAFYAEDAEQLHRVYGSLDVTTNNSFTRPVARLSVYLQGEAQTLKDQVELIVPGARSVLPRRQTEYLMSPVEVPLEELAGVR